MQRHATPRPGEIVSLERAAELLDLPMSTYKRHLRRGVERIVTDLWDRELSVVPSGP